MKQVKAKKHLGQHFLNDQNIALRIVESLTSDPAEVLEIGPGMGVLTRYLVQRDDISLRVIEIDTESVEYLHEHYPELKDRIIEGDFLDLHLPTFFTEPFSVIGNFPYNISSQIFFKVLEAKDQIPQVVGMLQKEVAERLASAPGKKAYGILSVLLQAWYDVEYLFTVDEHVFTPPPKVKSAVIRLTRNNTKKLDCNEVLFKQIIKATFNQRRKTIRNSIKAIPFNREAVNEEPVMQKRPEQLSVAEFVALTQLVEAHPLLE
ncbi:16S rRNA (adenine(1518)-N(6)/adenine(1519)-N(6))-dimethyltransferase RsmA [Marinilabiliaceae bacterium JC017]|nr:16S rRNA (adenine(1518)-N(6)/adenine(1519)-N(6))-dimethyltransferase RsmA [Marinilabiliaceae bacterium JC017]